MQSCFWDWESSLPREPSADAEAWLAGVSRETRMRLQVYHDLLIRWQRVKNLVSRNSIGDVWRRHFRDSAQLLRFAPLQSTWIDIGSGAGFPGLVLAILFTEYHPNSTVHLVESDHRKCAFLRDVVRETQANVTVHCGRIEEVVGGLPPIDIITARALAPLETLIEYSMPMLENGAQALFLKGRDVESELIAASKYSMMDIQLIASETDPDGRVVIIRKQTIPGV